MTPDQVSEIIRKLDSMAERIAELGRRLDVHEESHRSLNKDHIVFARSLEDQERRLRAVENRSERTERDLEKTTTALSKLLWIVIGQVVVVTSGGLLWAIVQAAK